MIFEYGYGICIYQCDVKMDMDDCVIDYLYLW